MTKLQQVTWKLLSLIYTRVEGMLESFKLGTRASTMMEGLRSILNNPLGKDALILLLLTAIMVSWYVMNRPNT